jgi:hypothetical protein
MNIMNETKLLCVCVIKMNRGIFHVNQKKKAKKKKKKKKKELNGKHDIPILVERERENRAQEY